MRVFRAQKVAATVPVGRRYPRRLDFRDLKSDRCPLCGADKRVLVRSIDRDGDDTLWVTWEELCENPDCTYNKIYMAKFFPYYTGLERKWVG